MWLKQGIICNNLAKVVVKSKEEIQKRNLKFQQNPWKLSLKEFIFSKENGSTHIYFSRNLLNGWF